ncbi:MAG: hypothetical protein KAR40_08010 [Candidatus Sabulitectum sp.]|nr:hypothetical protein [Candidatus Sabulitectum sp.]
MLEIGKSQSQLFAILSFLNTARDQSKQPFQPAYALINIGERLAMATDGHRVHWAAIDRLAGIEQGFYQVVKANKTTIIINKVDYQVTWPDAEGAIINYYKDSPPLATVGIEPPPTTGEFKVMDHGRNLTKIYRAMPESVSLNPDYVLDASRETTTCRVIRDDAPVFFDGEDCHAAVMPFKM